MAVSTISFTADTAIFSQLTQAMCATYGYQPTIPDPAHIGQTITNPQTPAQFAQQQIINYCANIVKAYEANLAAEAARAAAIAQVEATITAANISITAQ